MTLLLITLLFRHAQAAPYQGEGFTVDLPASASISSQPTQTTDRFAYSLSGSGYILLVQVFIPHRPQDVAYNLAHPQAFARSQATDGATTKPARLGPTLGYRIVPPQDAGANDRVLALQSPDGKVQYIVAARWSGRRMPSAVTRFFDTFRMAPVQEMAKNALVPFTYQHVVSLDVPTGWRFEARPGHDQLALTWRSPDRQGLVLLLVVDSPDADLPARLRRLKMSVPQVGCAPGFVLQEGGRSANLIVALPPRTPAARQETAHILSSVHLTALPLPPPKVPCSR
jgi:hypothetical protein